MTTNSDSRIVQGLKCKLNSVIKLKQNKEREFQKLKNLKSLKFEELKTVEDELEQLRLSFIELKEQNTKAQEEALEMELSKLSAEKKYECYKRLLEEHKAGFQVLFQREKKIVDDHYRTLKEKENKQLEEEKLKQQQLVEANEKRLQEAIAIEKECEAIEMECKILEKRNTAIMLRLCRKLEESERMQQSLMKKH